MGDPRSLALKSWAGTVSQLPSGLFVFYSMPEYAKGLCFYLCLPVVCLLVSVLEVWWGGLLGQFLGSQEPVSAHILPCLSCRLSLTAFFDDFLRLSWTTFATKLDHINQQIIRAKKLLQDIDETAVSVSEGAVPEGSLVGSRRLSEVQSLSLWWPEGWRLFRWFTGCGLPELVLMICSTFYIQTFKLNVFYI